MALLFVVAFLLFVFFYAALFERIKMYITNEIPQLLKNPMS